MLAAECKHGIRKRLRLAKCSGHCKFSKLKQRPSRCGINRTCGKRSKRSLRPSKAAAGGNARCHNEEMARLGQEVSNFALTNDLGKPRLLIRGQ